MGNYLQHHGIRGQRWYHRRFQNPDGSLTPEGKIRYANKAWDKLTKDEKMQRSVAKDATIATIAINGTYAYSQFNDLEKEMYYRKMTENYRAGKLKIEMEFERSYDDGSVMCKVSDVPVARIIIGRHGQLIRQMNEEWLPAIQDYYDFLVKEKENSSKNHFMEAKKGTPTRDQAKIVNDIKAFSPKKADHRYFDEDEAMADFNKQFREQFGDVNLFDNQAMMDAYDDKLIDFLDDAFS